jgi:hypothetical protein
MYIAENAPPSAVDKPESPKEMEFNIKGDIYVYMCIYI